MLFVQPLPWPELARHRQTQFELFIGCEQVIEFGRHNGIIKAQAVESARHVLATTLAALFAETLAPHLFGTTPN